MQKETKIQGNLFPRLEFTVFWGPMAVVKNFLKKNFSCENKKCLYIIYKHFLFLQLKIFSLKNFHDGHRTRKHGKFKSKKQIFLDFCFLLHEAPLDPNKGPCKRKNDLSKIWASYGRLKVFGCRWLNFAALWWPKYAFVAIFDSGFSISAKNRSIWYTNLKN